MWKYTPTNKTIRPGMAWTDQDGTRHPASWHTWSAAEKAAHNIVEVADPAVPDSRLYTWAQNPDGSITSAPKDINDRTETIDGKVVTFPGVKSVLMTQIKERQAQMLISTDWVFDGTQGPASESDPPNPINTYGFLKASSELVVTEGAGRGTIARIAGVQGVHRARPTAPRAQDAGFGYFVVSLVDTLRAGERFADAGADRRSAVRG